MCFPRRKIRIRRRRLPSSKSLTRQTPYKKRKHRKPNYRRRKKLRKQSNKRGHVPYILTPHSYEDDGEIYRDGKRDYKPMSATIGYDPDGNAYVRYINKRKLDTGMYP